MALHTSRDELHTVAGHQRFECPTIAACDHHIARLTELIRHPGQGTPAAIRCWLEDRDLLLEHRHFLHLMEAP